MPIEEVVEKYIQLINTEQFAKYEKDFACKVQEGLVKEYSQKSPEPVMVSTIEKIINNLNGLSALANKFSISTRSIFIHGKKSQVEFEYYGERAQRELGDLIFILSIIYKGKKYFEKFTISQFKKDNDRLTWDLSNKKQIYLLSRFPSFRGINGSLIPKREFNLPNHFGCLGSFNLLFRPGDFVFLSAQRLENFVLNRRSINIIDTYKLCETPDYYLTYPIPCNRDFIYEFLYLWQKKWLHEFLNPFFLPRFVGVLGFSRFAYNIYDFTDKYLRGYIGELTYSDTGIYNSPAFYFLQELFSAIMKKAQKEGKEEYVNFVNEFFGNTYSSNNEGKKENREFDFEGGNIGIIYTTINLGEGE